MEISEFVYTVLLKPKPLRESANAALRAICPKRKRLGDAWWTPNPNDPVVSGAATLGVYERSETAFFQAVCQPNMTFVDIGANTGYYSAWAMSLMKNQGQIVSVEPDPEALRYLNATREANASGIMRIVPCAASSREGTCELFRNPNNRGDNRLYENDLCSEKAVVQTKTVDSILAELGVKSVDLIKMDVQGFEGHVIQGMKATLTDSPHLTMLTEFWPWGLKKAGSEPRETLELLESFGFVLFELKKDGLLKLLTNHSVLIGELTGRKYTNLVGVSRKSAAFPVVEGRLSATA